jgi:hypothetical protein
MSRVVCLCLCLCIARRLAGAAIPWPPSDPGVTFARWIGLSRLIGAAPVAQRLREGRINHDNFRMTE